jgi:hypothetical protein
MRLSLYFGLLLALVFRIPLSIEAQDTAKQSILIGDVKITLGLQKEDLFRQLTSQHTMQDMTPTTELAAAPGYKLYLVYQREKKAGPVGELAFQDSVLVQAVRFWMTENADLSKGLSILGQAMLSLTAGTNGCIVRTSFPTGDSTNAIIVCGFKSLRIYDAQIEEWLSAQ